MTLDVENGLVVRNATVVNTRDGSLRYGQTIVIADGKILKISSNTSIRAGRTSQTIDATGKYVVPGYLDMHTHALDSIDMQPANWPMMIASGITGIREAGGVPNATVRAKLLNADSAAGHIDAPEVLMTPGDALSGMTSAAQAIHAVQQRKAQGADFIKVTSASREVMVATLSEAKAQGLTVAGHLTPALSAMESSQAGMRSIEHLGSSMGTLLDCSTDEAAIRQALLKGPGLTPPAIPSFSANAANAVLFQRVLDTYSEEKCQALAHVFVRNETWHVPTLIRVRTLLISDDPAYSSDPGAVYVDKGLLTSWQQGAQRFSTSLSAAERATFRQYYEQQKVLTKLLKQAGVKMLTGSDVSRISIWLVPGLSLHQDFHELASAGLTPLEVLQMTTLHGAEFLHREATMGTVDEGKRADLVLLDANPLVDVTNLSKIAAVILKGRFFSYDMLEKMKRDVARAQKNELPKHAVIALEPDHVD